MADSPLPERPRAGGEDSLGHDKDLERMGEDVEKISAQLTWMAYDMVVLRTIPELAASMLKLEEAYERGRAAVGGLRDQEPERSDGPGPPPAAHAQT
ncbi:synaptonemal complex central element protein 3 [Brachionichthys hirsutus]|uniref:synaptonemal complex central element protein 3 n=1 Tax=Brachionichthys hirsutus TaxID=412623 RepID=UPI003604CEB0